MTSPWPAPILAFASAASAVLLATARLSPLTRWALEPTRTRAKPGGALVRRLGRHALLGRLAGGDRLRARIGASGASRSFETVVGIKALVAVVAAVLGWALTGSVLVALALGFVGFRAPDLRLARAARLRGAHADRELPVFLDLLAAAAVAGLSGQLAARRAAEATEGPLADELATAFRRVDLGGRWRDELETAADRVGLPDLRRAATILTRSDVLGSSLAEAVSELARESRETRRAAVAERARKAPVKMLFPLVFLVLPAFLLLTVVPVLVTTLQSIR